MPMMFGPLLIGYFLSCSNMMKRRFGNLSFFSSSSFNSKTYTRALCQSTILSGSLVLSCAPHQEPRFLLPCLVPLMFLHGRDVVGMNSKQSNSKTARFTLTGVWVAFNFILYLFFGWLHQGGMVPSLLNLPSTAKIYAKGSPPEAVIYYKTYMPPTFLTLGRVMGNNKMEGRNTDRGVIVTDDGDNISVGCENQIIIDLQGREIQVLLEVLRERLPCHQSTDKSLLMVTPAAVMVTIAENEWNEYIFLSVHGHGTHVSTED
ncbi:hypothetical protein ACHAWC_001039, partial [Mediolabrus comicus]